jgi:hypothetical protein
MNTTPQPLTPAELAAFRARQKSRSRATALVLIALAVLFFAITLVKLREESIRDAHTLQQVAKPVAPRAPVSPGVKGQ